MSYGGYPFEKISFPLGQDIDPAKDAARHEDDLAEYGDFIKGYANELLIDEEIRIKALVDLYDTQGAKEHLIKMLEDGYKSEEWAKFVDSNMVNYAVSEAEK